MSDSLWSHGDSMDCSLASSPVVLEQTLKSHLDSKEIKPANPKGNQPWIFSGRTEAEAPIFWPPDAKSQLTLEKTLMLGKIESRRRGWQRMKWLDGITDSMAWVWASSGRQWRTGKPVVAQSNRHSPWGHKRLSGWTTTGSPALHCLPECIQINVHWVGGAI